MVFNEFHFENAIWLWGIMMVPAVWLLYGLFHRGHGNIQQLKGFIDEHLLPHLVLNKNVTHRSIWKSLLLWSVLWMLLMTALAGPRWDYKEVDVFKADQSLVILLDLSQSMDAEDEKPSRIARAKQEIEDLLRRAQGVKIALIAFAADPHMINPLTDDMEAIRHLLPSLYTDLVYVQGSRLSPAFEMASHMLASEPGNNKSILVITDGGFEDASTITTARKLASKSIVIHTMGIGSTEGAPVKDAKGNFIKQNGALVISKLEAEKLKEVSKAGGGHYIKAHYSDRDSRVVLDQLAARAEAEQAKKHTARHWEERFYLLLLPMMAILLFWFRKGFVFPAVLLLLCLPAEHANAAEIGNYFRNDQQLGTYALERGDYDTATQKFKDPYRQGVAHYRSGNFAEAEKTFRQSSRPEVSKDAAYNLGNALAKQQKYDEAIETYESLLEQYPDHEKAKHNLEIVKKLREQQQRQDGQDQNQQSQSQDNDDNNQESQNKNSDNASNDENQSDGKQDEEQSSKEGDGTQDHPQDSDDQAANEQEGADTGASEEEQLGQQEENAVQGKEEQQQPEAAKNDAMSQVGEDQADEKSVKTQQDIDADQWLNRVTNDPKLFLKNQFYIESKRKGTKEGSNPW